MLRWPGRNLGFEVVSVIVPPAAKLFNESNSNCGGSGTPVAQSYGVIRACQVPSNNAGACDRPKPWSSAAAGPQTVGTARTRVGGHTGGLIVIILSPLMGGRG